MAKVRSKEETKLVVRRCTSGPRKGKAQKQRVKAEPSRAMHRLRERFLAALADTSNVAEACRVIGRSSGTVYRWRKDEAFREAWDRALEEGFAALEMELLRRARFGQDVIEYRYDEKGQEVPVKRVHSYDNRLALQLLAQHRQHVAEYRAARGVREDARAIDIEELKGRLAAMRVRLAAPEEEEDA